MTVIIIIIIIIIKIKHQNQTHWAASNLPGLWTCGQLLSCNGCSEELVAFQELERSNRGDSASLASPRCNACASPDQLDMEKITPHGPSLRSLCPKHFWTTNFPCKNSDIFGIKYKSYTILVIQSFSPFAILYEACRCHQNHLRWLQNLVRKWRRPIHLQRSATCPRDRPAKMAAESGLQRDFVKNPPTLIDLTFVILVFTFVIWLKSTVLSEGDFDNIWIRILTKNLFLHQWYRSLSRYPATLDVFFSIKWRCFNGCR